MLRPSYSELMETINTNDELNSSKITSRYTIVLAAAKRARQIIDGANPLTYAPTDRAVSIAVKEMQEGKLHLDVQDEILDGTYERMLQDQYKNRSLAGVSKDDLREELKDNYDDAPDFSYDDDDDFTEEFAEIQQEKDDFAIYEEDGAPLSEEDSDDDAEDNNEEV